MSINYVVSPGDYLGEWLEDMQVSQTELAQRLGTSRKQVNSIINGRSAITASMATALERVTRISSETWLRYEARYRSELERLKSEQSLEQYADCISPDLAKYMRAIGATTATRRNPGAVVSDFLSFHHFGTFEAYKESQGQLFKGDFSLATLRESQKRVDPFALTTWIAVGNEAPICEKLDELTFNEEKLRECLGSLKARACHPDQDLIKDAQQILLSAGVVLLVVEPPSKFPLHGVTRWVDRRIPVIQQTLRKKNDGYFSWTLFHELGHVLGDERETLLDTKTTTGFSKTQKENEKKANRFASQQLFGDWGLGRLRWIDEEGAFRQAAIAEGIPVGPAIHELHRTQARDYWWGAKMLYTLDFEHQADWAVRE